MISAGVPNITGGFGVHTYMAGSPTGAFTSEIYGNKTHSAINTGDSYNFVGIQLNASGLNNIYGNSDTVQPPAITTQYLVKY